MNYESIPQILRTTGQFCTWRYEKQEGRTTKVPYNPQTMKKVRTNDPSTFVDCQTALDSLSAYDGIGFRIAGHVIGIDLDHCIEEKELLPWAKEIVSRFSGAYIEFSPSGTGLHILTLMPAGYTFDRATYGIKLDNIEVYVPGATNRYLTFTGNIYQHGNIVEEPEALQWLLETHMKKAQPNCAKQISSRSSYLSDESILEKAGKAKNGTKFNKLWGGDISDYPSKSEADAALCFLLAFYANGNLEQVDRLFRKSCLYREKWDERHGSDTYGNITLKKVVNNMTNFYKPMQTDPMDDFNDEQKRLEQLNPLDRGAYPWNDIGAGKLFADFYQDILRYVAKRKTWFYYDKGIWSADTGSLHAMKLCMNLANLLHLYTLKITDEDTRKTYIKYVGKWQAHTYRVNVLKDAQVHHPITYLEFDSNPYAFNCSNGTLHLDTNTFTEHLSTDLLTKISAVVYDPLAKSPRWDNFLKEIMSGDMERARFLQKLFGYALTGDTRHECMTVLYGATTRNGKGTLCESILKVLGGYGCTARPETIAQKNNNNSSNPSEDIARLAGVRLVNIAEPGKSLVLNAAQIKNMTGNDTINARFLHENSFDFRPQFKLYINTNYLPIVNDMTVFASGRLFIIPFERHFEEAEQDKGLKHEFTKAETQSAILNWLIEGYVLLRKEGLHPPASVQNATKEYQHDSNKTLLFIEDCLEAGSGYEERTATVYFSYKNWCHDNGHYPESMKTFKQSLAPFMEIIRKRPKVGGEKTTMVLGYRVATDFNKE